MKVKCKIKFGSEKNYISSKYMENAETRSKDIEGIQRISRDAKR
jgi:hypothetical protein